MPDTGGWWLRVALLTLVLCAPCCRQPWTLYELKLPADSGARALEWAEKLQMKWFSTVLTNYLQRIAKRAS